VTIFRIPRTGHNANSPLRQMSLGSDLLATLDSQELYSKVRIMWTRLHF
jgi:hypothetical protein